MNTTRSEDLANTPITRLDITDLAALQARIGQEIGVSPWLDLKQWRIDGFAEVTEDRQWIHIDVERAARESPFGGPVAHGFLTLSLLPKFMQGALAVEGARMGVNYGLNRVRFTSPVPADSRLRGRFVLAEAEPIAQGVQIVWQASIEIEGRDKPACVAELVTRSYR